MKQLRKLLVIFIFNLSSIASAQIATSSFFPKVKTINPGIAHLRRSGFLSIDSSKSIINKKQDINAAGIIDGVNTEVNLNKTTFYRAGKGPGVTVELLFDREEGTKKEYFETPTYERSIITNGSSSTYGAIIDLGLFGINLSKGAYDNFLDFHVGETPNLNRITHDTSLNYDLIRLGTSFNLLGVSIGGFYSSQRSSGSVNSILYNPSNGNKNSPEVSLLEYETISYGVGISRSTDKVHLEASLEKTTSQSLKQSNTYLLELETPNMGERISLIGELRLGSFAFGLRVRQINGNYSDFDQLISSNILYLNTDEQDSRLENSFNFTYGSGRGYSLSGFYTTSELNTEEPSQFENDKSNTYNTIIKSTSYGLSLNYTY